MKIVIAGNYHQYRDWLVSNQLSPKDARYIADVHHLRGLRDCEVEYVGTWTQSQVLKDQELAAYLIKRATERR